MNNRTLEQCLKSNYNRSNFIALAREIIPFEVAEPIPIETTSAEKEKVEAFNYLGAAQVENKNIHLLEVELKNTALERSPTFQRNLIAKYLKSNLADAAIVSFYSKNAPSWKLSLVTITYKFDENGKIKEELSEAKRFSFIVGMGQPVHTATVQLEKLAGKQNSYQDILDAFSVERVTKDFFIQIASAFRKLVGGKEKINNRTEDFGEGVLQLPTEDKKVRQEFAIRLINRLIFCWFLKKKKTDTGKTLISNKLLSSKSVESYKNEIPLQFIADSYYHDIVEPLFFEIMNKPQDKRLAKYAKVREFNDIPFLNGGLFEPNKLSDFYELDKATGIAKSFNAVKVPDDWFKHFFEILETYNFTVDENTPVEIELSIDPEMLGRIFENLLAEINPETGETARKATGSYYTPRTIVEFMVNESLKYYLADKTGIDTNKIENLLSYSSEGTHLTEEEKDKILNALDSLKILDPACGSGAFPMGALQKMLLILQKVDPENKKWFEKFINKIPDSLMREETRKKFEGEDLDYLRKLAILQHSIYGVDIQPMATEISRLRAFLSLIVDAKVDSTKKNMGIEPLPNLDFKFVTANSLIDIEKIIEQEDSQLIKDSFFEEFKKLTQKYFVASDAEEKNSIRKHIERLIDKKVQEKIDHIEELSKVLDSRFGISKENKAKIEKLNYEADLWRSYKNIFKGEPVKFFNTKYFFPDVKNGFDIVIANPPYIQLQKAFNENKKYADLYKSQNYETFDRTGDIYCLFYERGLNLLKERGVLTYISSNKWMRAKYGRKLRKYFSKFDPKIIIDLGPNVFKEATVDTSILLIRNAKNQNSLQGVSVSGKRVDNLSVYFNENAVALPDFDGETWIIGSNDEQKLKEKIERIGVPLKDWDVNIYYGIKTGFNKAFIITTEKRNEILANCRTAEERQRTEEIIKPILRGRDIGRYYYKWKNLWVILIKYRMGEIVEQDKEKWHAIYYYLNQYKKQLENRGQCRYSRNGNKKGQHHWLELDNNPKDKYLSEFEKNKIAWQRVTKTSMFCLVNKDIFVQDSMAFIISDKNIKYLLALLNSKVINKYFESIAHQYGNTGFLCSNQYVERLPIPKITPQNANLANKIENLVNQILAITSKETYNPKADTADNRKVKALECQIDQLVYKLYGLTPEEIKIVEENS
jgi:adenine-specific DNA-methyltransferase